MTASHTEETENVHTLTNSNHVVFPNAYHTTNA